MSDRPISPRRRAPRGRRRRRREAFVESAARIVITAGGLGTIVAVSSILVFLLWVVLPLFLPPQAEAASSFAGAVEASEVRDLGLGEHGTAAWLLTKGGTVIVRRLDDGERVSETRPFGETAPTAASFEPSGAALFGFADGSVRSARVGFSTRFLEDADVPASLRSLEIGESAILGGGLLVRTPAGQLRHDAFELVLEEALAGGSDAPVVQLAGSTTARGGVFATLHADGKVHLSHVSERQNLLTREVTRRVTGVEVDFPTARGAPERIVLAGGGNHLYLIWRGGELVHVDARNPGAPRVAEEIDVVPETDAHLTAARLLNGGTSLMVGDSRGRLRAWFPVTGVSGEGFPLLRAAQRLEEGASAVISLAPSQRSRLLAAGYADGSVRLFHVTSAKTLLEVRGVAGADAVALSPKEDRLVSFGREVRVWAIDARFPEATFSALFRPVWYEGYGEPAHVWQSSAGTDDFEPKLGLVPLVFGTLKATLYSMLFGAPLALLAAIYTSEFLVARLRAPVKSTIELMASLPSVVLGFLAALVIAPFVNELVPALLVALLTVPLAVLLGAHLWQLLPPGLAVRWSGVQRFVAIALCLPIGVLAARLFGPAFERLFFAGDVKAWLDGRAGGPFGGWFLLTVPASALIVVLSASRWITPRLRAVSADWTRARAGRVDLLKFLAAAAATIALASLAAALLGAMGLDPRGGIFGTYVQRNAAIVGFVMGFAIVPIVYTLAEDALSDVPAHLREGSLGAGATRWQTALRIVLPTAMSGLFSAVMIGLGRAVGETMIVLMAAGNTPILDWNVFNGFRTLSANIAVELPEAVRGSTHYRTLFLAALVLFAMTFVLNTFAELVRRHFRKRARAL